MSVSQIVTIQVQSQIQTLKDLEFILLFFFSNFSKTSWFWTLFLSQCLYDCVYRVLKVIFIKINGAEDCILSPIKAVVRVLLA